MSLIGNLILTERSLPRLITYVPVRNAQKVRRPEKYHYEYTNASLWRKSRGRDSNPNRYGPLTNAPDYSYLDGRPTPLGINLNSRMVKQQEYMERINKLSAEVDFARERHQQALVNKEQFKSEVIGNKLKRKGPALLKNKSENYPTSNQK